ncbi:MAG: FG-GAP repeat domain-containing protein, partial [Akkermansiaceae bacterium]
DRKITSLALAHVNSDSRPDLVAVSHASDEIIWLDLSSSPAVTHTVSTSMNGPEAVISIEATGDSHNDLIISSRWNRNITLLSNDGSGNFSSSTLAANIDTAVSLASADLDGNNEPDIIGISDHGKELFWLSQSTAGTFSAKQSLASLPNTPQQVSSTDLNNDGAPDILVLSGGIITLFENDGNAQFTPTARLGSAITSFVVADVTGGLPDIITASSTLGTSHLFTNDNIGGFSNPLLLSSALTGHNLLGVDDLDRDSKTDLLYQQHSTGNLTWLRGNGTGTFTLQPTSANAGNSIDRSICGILADFDGDQDTDLALASLAGHNLALHQGLASSPYEFWAYDQGIDPMIETPSVDTNNNGAKNVLHYAFNTSPTSSTGLRYLTPASGTRGLPTLISHPSSTRSIEFVRRTSNRPHGLSYLVQQSSTLGGWTSVTLNSGNSTVTPIDADWERVRYTPPSPQGQRLFLRLQVEYNQP